MSPETAFQAQPQYTECVPPREKGLNSGSETVQMSRRIQELIEQIQAQQNPTAKALLQECLQTLLAFYGNGLARILEHIQASGAESEKIMDRILRDQASTGLLLIHGLHPVELEDRLRGALDKVRPYMQSHGGDIQLLGLESDVARVRLQGTCKGCPSSAITLELAVRRAVEEACPDLLGFEVEGDGKAT